MSFFGGSQGAHGHSLAMNCAGGDINVTNIMNISATGHAQNQLPLGNELPRLTFVAMSDLFILLTRGCQVDHRVAHVRTPSRLLSRNLVTASPCDGDLVVRKHRAESMASQSIWSGLGNRDAYVCLVRLL